MTTNPMTCETFEQRLMAYLEHETDDATHVAMDRHAVACARCGALIADMRKLRFDAANLPELQPSRDLWAGIAARIEAPVVSIAGHRTDAEVATRRRQWTRFALVAAALVVAAGLGYAAAVRRVGSPAPASAAVGGGDTMLRVAVAPDTPQHSDSTTRNATGSTSIAAPARVARNTTRERVSAQDVRNSARPSGAQTIRLVNNRLTADYDREIARLRVLIEQRRNQLDPVTVAIIETNLRVIDTAIAQCRMAIARDPASHFLLESLNQSLQTKVELMRTAALLPSRT